jgi:hypothetical protein
MSEQTAFAAWSAIISSWERGNHGVLQTENNFNVLKAALLHAIGQGVAPSKEAWLQIVATESDAGHLQLNQPPQVAVAQPPAAPDPAQHLPHADVKEIAFLDSVEAVKKFKERVAKDGLAYMSGFKRLRLTETKDYQILNERMQYLVEHDIHKAEPEQPATPAKPLTPAQIEKNNLVAEAQAIVDGLNPSNIGATTSVQGRWDRLNRLKARCQDEVAKMQSACWLSQAKAGLQAIKDMVAQAESSSIR